MSELRVASINNPSAGSGGLAISAAGNVTGAGLDLIVTESFSAVSSVSLDNCFSGDYDNYRLLITVTASTSAFPSIRLRASGSDITGANYNDKIATLTSSSTTVTWANQTNHRSATYSAITTDSTSEQVTSLDFYAPNLNSVKYWFGDTSAIGLGNIGLVAGGYSSATVADGMTVLAPSGTITGSLSVYGYKS